MERSDANRFVPLNFPATRNALWDYRAAGPTGHLHLIQNRNVLVSVSETPLRLLQRLAEESEEETYRCSLLGSLEIGDDGETLCMHVERLDQSCQMDAFGLAASEMVIPCKMTKNSARPSSSVEEYTQAVQKLKSTCTGSSSLNSIDASHFMHLMANCSFHDNQSSIILHMDCDLITLTSGFKVTPVNPVPIVPTALSKNLSGPAGAACFMGQPKFGFLTMDQTRKLLLVLATDPKVAGLPLVGVWVSGVGDLNDPVVWAACMRYIHSSHLQERVCLPPEHFLLVMYSPRHSKPLFHQCSTVSGSCQPSLQLSSAHEVLQLPKNGLCRSQTPLEMDLSLVETGPKRTMFDAALQNLQDSGSLPQKKPVTPQKNEKADHALFAMDDITPRSKPTPYRRQAPTVRYSVPDVSLLEESLSDPPPPPLPTSYQPSMPPQQMKPAVSHPQTPVQYASAYYGHMPHHGPRPPCMPLQYPHGPYSPPGTMQPPYTTQDQQYYRPPMPYPGMHPAYSQPQPYPQPQYNMPAQAPSFPTASQPAPHPPQERSPPQPPTHRSPSQVPQPKPSSSSPHHSSPASHTSVSPHQNSTDSGLPANRSDLNDSLESVSRSSQIPPEVYELLSIQENQLKELRQQIAQLLANQQQKAPTRETGVQSCQRPESSTCSIAVNTSLWVPEKRAVSRGTSPLKQPSRDTSSHLDNETVSLEDLHLSQIQDRTESFVSEMIVDMPAYSSVSPDKNDASSFGSSMHSSDTSPHSISMHAQQEESLHSECPPSPQQQLLLQNHKEFYHNLLGNVQKMLHKADYESPNTSSSKEPDRVEPHEEEPAVNEVSNSSVQQQHQQHQQRHQKPAPRSCDQSIDVAQMTRKQLERLGIRMESLLDNSARSQDQSLRPDQSTFLLDAAMLPKVDYRSLWLDSGDSDLSADADALAMKYLTDEQLSELAKMRGGKRRAGNLSRIMAASSREPSMFGHNHMSLSSRKYLERYGLLSSTGNSSPSVQNDTMTESDRGAEPAVMNVQQFLQQLAEKSYLADVLKPRNRSGSVESSSRGSSEESHSLSSGCPCAAGPSGAEVDSDPGGSFRAGDLPSSTPASQPRHRPAVAQHTPMRPTRKSKGSPEAQAKAPSAANSPAVTNRVLDIDRLRELPKLL